MHIFIVYYAPTPYALASSYPILQETFLIFKLNWPTEISANGCISVLPKIIGLKFSKLTFVFPNISQLCNLSRRVHYYQDEVAVFNQLTCSNYLCVYQLLNKCPYLKEYLCASFVFVCFSCGKMHIM